MKHYGKGKGGSGRHAMQHETPDPGTNRGGRIEGANPDGSGGKSKGSPSAETLVEYGVQHRTPISEQPGDVGMDTVGMSEKPRGIYKGSLSTDRGKFRCK